MVREALTSLYDGISPLRAFIATRTPAAGAASVLCGACLVWGEWENEAQTD